MILNKNVSEKPNKQIPSPVIQAHVNFKMARAMHVENLEHQPLPDCMADQSYLKQQAEGINYPELSLDVLPTATGVGVKTYKAGPTHCTKMNVYRPKTCGVIPQPVRKWSKDACTTVPSGKPSFDAIDLALGWEYRPLDPRDEPKPPNHIDGTNNSMAPAVFVLVNTPKSKPPFESGTSGGIFANTLGEPDFFNRNVIKQNSHENRRTCTCGTSPIKYKKEKHSADKTVDGNMEMKRSKSFPQLNVDGSGIDCDEKHIIKEHTHKRQDERKICKHTKSQVKRPLRLCEMNLSQNESKHRNSSSGQSIKSNGCKSHSASTCTSFGSGDCSTLSIANSSKTVHVPKIKPPYSKKNYIIDTLAPPFACWKGGAGQGGYPEHWRLASIYQHAYKPVEQRKRPLLATVYQ